MKLVWLLIPLAIQIPTECKPNKAKSVGPAPVLKCTEERQKCQGTMGKIGRCVVGNADSCERPPCLLCQY